MSRNSNGDQVGNPRRLLFVLSVLVMAGVIGVFVVAAIWPRADATDPADAGDFNTEDSAPTAAATPPSADSSDVGVASLPPGEALSPRGDQILLPDPTKTPGDVLPATAAQICVSGYSKSVRNVTPAEKNKVYASYGIKTHAAGQYEVDHLISLELGGSNDIKNLWPEPAEPRPGFHEKDTLENTLHKLVCAGSVPLAEAQQAIAKDWYGAYIHYVMGK